MQVHVCSLALGAAVLLLLGNGCRCQPEVAGTEGDSGAPAPEEAPLPSVLEAIRDGCKASPKLCTQMLRQVGRERINNPVVDGQTPLVLAVRLARPLAVTTLLDMGADKSIAAGAVAVTYACSWTTSLGSLDLMFKIVMIACVTLALVYAEDGQGNTPLHAAAAMGNTEIAQLLLEAGDDPNHVGPDGFAPIHRAVQGEGLGHTEVVELLLKHGVSVNQPAADGKAPIELVRYNRATRERLQHELRRHREL
jgi:hypothetical protein